MPGLVIRGGKKETAEAIAIAAFLLTLAYVVIDWGAFGVRVAVAMLIAAPSAVMLGYYLLDREAKDRIYSIGLFSTILLASFLVAGLEARIVVAAFLAVAATLIILSRIKIEE